MISDTTREAWRFFHAQAAYCTPPGHAACALDLAHAEQLYHRAEREGLATIEWSDDPEPLDTDDDTTQAMIDDGHLVGPAICTLYVIGYAAASFCGVVLIAPSASGDDPYRRVVEAELAAGASEQLRAAFAAAGIPDPTTTEGR